MIRLLLPGLLAACTAPGMRSLHAPPQESVVPIHPACEPANLKEHGLDVPQDVDCKAQARREQTWRTQVGVFGDHARLVFAGDVGVRNVREGLTRRREVGVGPRAVAEAAEGACGGACDGVVLLGDNLYKSGVNDGDDTAFVAAMGTVWSWAGPSWWVQGNHDWGAYPRVFTDKTHKPPSRDRAQRLFRDLRFLSEEGSLDLRGDSHFWGTAAGPGRLVALDTNYLVRRCKAGDDGVRCKGDPRRDDDDRIAIRSLIERTVTGSMGPVVAVGHHPWLSHGEHGSAGVYLDTGRKLWSGEAMQQVFDGSLADNVALYLSGHDHNTQVARVDGDTLAIVVGAGGKTTGPGGDTAPGGERHRGEIVQESFCDLGFAVVDVGDGRMTVDVHTVPHPDPDDPEVRACRQDLAERRPDLRVATSSTCTRWTWTAGVGWGDAGSACVR